MLNLRLRVREAIERAAHDAGADLFLTKPYSPLDLLRPVDEPADSTDVLVRRAHART